MKFILLPALFLVIAVSLFGSADGQVSSVTLTIATGDRVPFATSKSITVAFTLATALSNGGRVTINYPTGFFASCIQPVVSGHPVISSSTETGLSSLVLTVNGTLAAAATTVTLLGLTMGGPNAGSNGITVSTSSDAASSAVASGTIGGQVASVTMTIANADRAAGATGKAVTIAFTTTVALASGDKVTISYPSSPSSFFAPSVTPTVAPTTLSAAATGASSIILTASSAITNGTITVTLSGMTLGAAVSNAANGIIVSTNKDLASTGGASGAIGQVTGVSFAPQTRTAAGTSEVIVGFTFGVALAAADKVTINYPNGFFTTAAAASINSGGNLPSTVFERDTALNGATSLAIIVKSGQTVAAGAAQSITLVGMTMGSATAGANEITVSAPGNAVSTEIVNSGGIGAIYGVSVIAISSNIVGATSVTVTITFTPSVELVATDTITISYPSGYFSTTQAPSSIAGGPLTDTFALLNNTYAPEPAQYIFKIPNAKTAPKNVAQTVTLSGLTLGASRVAASATGFKVQATSNAISSGALIGAIGAAVTNLGALTIAPADRAAGATGKSVTLAFTTTVELVQGDKVTISYPSSPSSFFAPSVTPTVAPTTLSAAATGASSIILTASSTITAGVLTVTLSGMTLGAAVGNAPNGIIVTTDKNPGIPTGTATGLIGQVTGVTFAISSTDRVAGATGKDVTIAFNIPVALAAADKVTINYPSGYFGTTASTPSAIKVTNSAGSASADFQADTTAPGATSLTIVVKSGQTPSGAQTLVLVGMTMGAATAGSATGITVSAPGNAVSAGQDSGAIGGAVTGVSFISGTTLRAGATNASVTVSFTTASVTPATTGKITINYPSGYFATSATPAVYSPATIASSAAPTATAIVLTVGSAAISASAITVVLGGLTIGSNVACSATGITVSTSADYAAASSPALTIAVSGGGSPGVTAGPSSSKSHASFLCISASFVLAFAFAVLA